jgi:hypothetical protein
LLQTCGGDRLPLRSAPQQVLNSSSPDGQLSIMPVELEYRGNETLDDMQAFNARMSIAWKGDLLFRVYPTPERVFFIKIGGSKKQQMAVHFGLIGMLIAHFSNKKEAKRTEDRLARMSGLNPALLMKEDKANHVRQMSEIMEPTINGGSIWTDKKFGSWSFRDARGKKRELKFEDATNFREAVRWLSQTFGERLIVNAQWDDAKGKVVKV